MRILLFITFFLLSILANAQNRDTDINVGPEFMALFNKLSVCIENKEQDCVEIINEIIEKGKRENVAFLDYLYANKAFYFWNLQEMDSTMLYSQLAIENPHPIEKQRSDLDAYNLLANAYYHKDDLDSAIKYYLKVAAILEDGGNPVHLGYLYVNIGTLLSSTENYDKQIEYLLKSYNLLDEHNDEKFIATAASNLGLGYYNLNDTINAIKWSEKALDLSDISNDLEAKTLSFLTLSLIEKDLNKSLKYAKKAVEYAVELENKIHLTSTHYTYADLLYKTGSNKEALKYAEQAINFAKEVGDNSILTKASLTAASIYYNSGLKEKAADFYHTYATFKDSISSAENAREINEINTKYETEKKEKQIVQQEFKIQKQQSNLLLAILGGALLISILGGAIFYNKKKQESRLKQLQKDKENAILNSFILGEERERKRISHELHDGVAAMIGAAKMSLESIPHLPQEKRMEQLAKVQRILERSHADTRHIAHNLLPTVLEQDGLVKATEQFVSEINETKLIKISVTDNHENTHKLSQQLQLMIFRVIQELVNNIIKHSEAANAEIKFSNNSNGLQIEITDDGIGYEDSEEARNQGLYSISQRLKSIGGNFEITKRKSGGTQAKVAVTV